MTAYSLNSGVTESLFIYLGGGGGGRPSSGGGGRLEDGISLICFPHQIYCAQSKVKWGGGGGRGLAWPPIVTPLSLKFTKISNRA